MKLISSIRQRPRREEPKRRRLIIRMTEHALRMPLTSAKTSAFCVASTRFFAREKTYAVGFSCVPQLRIFIFSVGAMPVRWHCAEIYDTDAFLAFVDSPSVPPKHSAKADIVLLGLSIRRPAFPFFRFFTTSAISFSFFWKDSMSG
jgi:hypothetical protein